MEKSERLRKYSRSLPLILTIEVCYDHHNIYSFLLTLYIVS